jgi:hypothetical protein
MHGIREQSRSPQKVPAMNITSNTFPAKWNISLFSPTFISHPHANFHLEACVKPSKMVKYDNNDEKCKFCFRQKYFLIEKKRQFAFASNARNIK